ncbi:solute carrier family 22 member 6-A-like [Mizuhopecten yessoensis]|uniref:Solute carrier family 22 member 6-A n=1 Tax=Mizuhopecten yessoensis TaxID=6573 RepID=A0A210PZD7_MIZYE|nr:solute carrier family 22 member 6-A-like [Mizuhopecten yessoensis]OWF41857.1 Solute carrier family 22 member 6-A [Mizuhopecten yessoensis]
MQSISEFLEDILQRCGGFGRFQFLMYTVVMGSKLPVAWSMMMMSYVGVIPDWWCDYNVPINRTDSHVTESPWTNSSFKKCSPPANTSVSSCSRHRFQNDMYNIVNEWNLVCDRELITSTITTIQMAGLFVSGFFSGHFADAYGRKPIYFLSVLTLAVTNVIAAYSVSWQMFAVLRFFIGFAVGCYIAVFYTYLIEFTPARYRAMTTTFPIWAVWCGLFAFVCMWLHNWKYLHLATAVTSVPWLLAWWYFPESFRWLVTHGKEEQAVKIVIQIAKTNSKDVPDTTRLTDIADSDSSINQSKQSFTLRDILCSRKLLSRSLLLAVGWVTAAYVYYAISFGVQNLSGNIYINIFLINIIDIPAQIVTYYMANCIGRRLTCLVFFVTGGLAGIVVACVEISDIEHKNMIINGFALTCKLCVGAAWTSLIVFTAETYPTVVRNIGNGLQNSLSRLGGMVSPLIVYVNNRVPGIMYFLCGGLMLLSAFCTMFVPETKGVPLSDTIDQQSETESEKERLLQSNTGNGYRTTVPQERSPSVTN